MARPILLILISLHSLMKSMNHGWLQTEHFYDENTHPGCISINPRQLTECTYKVTHRELSNFLHLRWSTRLLQKWTKGKTISTRLRRKRNIQPKWDSHFWMASITCTKTKLQRLLHIMVSILENTSICGRTNSISKLMLEMITVGMLLRFNTDLPGRTE